MNSLFRQIGCSSAFFFLFVLFYLSECVVVQLCRNFLYFMSDFISGTFLQIQLSGRICHVSCFSFQLEQRQRYKQNNIQIYINHWLKVHDVNVCVCMFLSECMDLSFIGMLTFIYMLSVIEMLYSAKRDGERERKASNIYIKHVHKECSTYWMEKYHLKFYCPFFFLPQNKFTINCIHFFCSCFFWSRKKTVLQTK